MVQCFIHFRQMWFHLDGTVIQFRFNLEQFLLNIRFHSYDYRRWETSFSFYKFLRLTNLCWFVSFVVYMFLYAIRCRSSVFFCFRGCPECISFQVSSNFFCSFLFSCLGRLRRRYFVFCFFIFS